MTRLSETDKPSALLINYVGIDDINGTRIKSELALVLRNYLIAFFFYSLKKTYNLVKVLISLALCILLHSKSQIL